MSTFLVIGVALGLWSVALLVVLAVCRAAGRGDEALMGESPVSTAAMREPVTELISPRAPAPSRGLIGRPRLH